MLLGMAFALIGAAPAAHRSIPSNLPLQFVDLTGDFDRVWAKTRNVPDVRRVEAFEAEFEKVLPGFYSAKRVSDFISADGYHDMVLKGLKNYPQQRPGIRRVSREFSALIAPARHQFEAYFGSMRGYPPIYLVNSFGEFDGGTRDLGDGSHLMFGADMIDRLYKATSLKSLVAHELFHLLHHQTFHECGAVWCNLWEEGLATYVDATLNPGADDAALGLTIPQPIRPVVDANRAAALCAVRGKLESEKPEDYSPLFYGNKSLPGFPPRMGYYVGYLVAQDIGRTRNLKQLAALKPDQVKPLVVESLDRLGACGKP